MNTLGFLLQIVEHTQDVEFQDGGGPNLFLMLLVLAAMIVVFVVAFCAIIIAGLLIVALLFALFTGMTVSAILTGWAKGKISIGVMMFFVQCGLLSGAVLGLGLGAILSMAKNETWWDAAISLPSCIVFALLGGLVSWLTVKLWMRLLQKLHAWWEMRKQ